MMSEPADHIASLRKELAERLGSFFIEARDGRNLQAALGVAVATAQGPHRDRNEDRCAAVHLSFGNDSSDLRLGIVCDGMGGMAKGAEAATLAVSSFIASLATANRELSLELRLSEACEFANQAVYAEFRGEAGTTLTAIALGSSTVSAIHVGDSRLYQIDDRRNVMLVTKDDTVSGAINAHYGQDDEDDMDNRLLQFVGLGEGMEAHALSIDQHDHASWLLTSDGAHGIGRKALDGVCEGAKSPVDLVRKVIYVSEAINTRDNASAVCLASGFDPVGKESHQGLTLEIVAPHRSLEIWLPSSAFNYRRSTLGGSQMPPVMDVEERRRQAQIEQSNDLPRKPRSRAKGRSKREKPRDSEATQIPLGVVFDISDK